MPVSHAVHPLKFEPSNENKVSIHRTGAVFCMLNDTLGLPDRHSLSGQKRPVQGGVKERKNFGVSMTDMTVRAPSLYHMPLVHCTTCSRPILHVRASRWFYSLSCWISLLIH